MVKFTPLPLYPPVAKARVPIGENSGWALESVWTLWRDIIVHVWALQDHNPSIYRLSRRMSLRDQNVDYIRVSLLRCSHIKTVVREILVIQLVRKFFIH
jgi:hypothetical protein